MRRFFFNANGEARPAALVALILVIALSAWLESCALVERVIGSKRDDLLKFSHSGHEQFVQDCNACHSVEGLGIVRASHASCVQCHSAADREREPDRACLVCHHTLTMQRAAPTERPDYSKAFFEHGFHETVSCADCHGQVTRGGLFSAVDFPVMEDCLACHFPAVAEPSRADCLTCHFDITPETPPKNHASVDWAQNMHGIASNIDPGRCARCHVKAQRCDSCHAVERPRTHTAVFRIRIHGFRALNNPNRCATCHQQDFCEACHRTTEPQNHNAAFKRRPFLHCATCHLPLEQGNRCSVCHLGDPHIDVIAPPPPPQLVQAGAIDLSQPCLPCHPVRQVPIPHPYNTIDPLQCIQCHRPI